MCFYFYVLLACYTLFVPSAFRVVHFAPIQLSCERLFHDAVRTNVCTSVLCPSIRPSVHSSVMKCTSMYLERTAGPRSAKFCPRIHVDKKKFACQSYQNRHILTYTFKVKNSKSTLESSNVIIWQTGYRWDKRRQLSTQKVARVLSYDILTSS